MARSSKLRVMLSSKCNVEFPAGSGRQLSDIRRDLKADIEKMEIAGKKAFEVWINEEAPPKGGTWNSWEVCMEAVKACDILIVLSNGDAGGAANAGEIGICHAEMMIGLSLAPAKVRLIALPNVARTEDAAGLRNARFQDELGRQSLFRGGTVKTEKALTSRVFQALHDAVVALAQAGVGDAAKGKYSSGAALDWTRLDFSARRDQMVAIVRHALLGRPGSREVDGRACLQLGGAEVLVEAHAIPAALTVGPAREMVGQPFLRDHELAASLQGAVGGPLHVIACQKTATESQAAKLLGFPDATIVAAPFGVFVADRVQKVQFAFITNCRDESNTRHGVQRFFQWLSQTQEEAAVAERALGRARIVRVVAEVLAGGASSPPASVAPAVKRKPRATSSAKRSKK
jgi:hypothetical protein